MNLDDIVWPQHKGGLHISHNLHHSYHETVAEALESGPGGHPTYDAEDFPEPAEIEWAIATDSVWTIQWYPDTPVGFRIVHASTLQRALEAAISAE